MKTRETSYEDYGFDINEAKRLKEYCRSPHFSDHKTLMDSAISANPCIASDLYYSIAGGVSYDDLIKIKYIPLPKTDFYGYQRRCLATFRNFLLIYGKWK